MALSKIVSTSIKNCNKQLTSIRKEEKKIDKKIAKIIKPIIEKCVKEKDKFTLIQLGNMMDYSHNRQFIYKAIYQIEEAEKQK